MTYNIENRSCHNMCLSSLKYKVT